MPWPGWGRIPTDPGGLGVLKFEETPDFLGGKNYTNIRPNKSIQSAPLYRQIDLMIDVLSIIFVHKIINPCYAFLLNNVDDIKNYS